jgi:tetratricopeptide (TPR) repeat protein
LASRASIGLTEWTTAQQLSNKLIQAKPQDAVGYYLSGIALLGDGRKEEGRKQLFEAIHKEPNSVEPLNILVRSYLEDKSYDQALNVINKVINNSNKHFIAHNLKGEVLLLTSDKRKAISAFNEAISHNPSFHVPYRNLADIYMSEGKADKAIEILQKGIEQTGNNPMLMFALAGIYERNEKADEAIAVYEAILQSEPDSEIAINNLAMLLAINKSSENELDRALNLVRQLRNSSNPSYLDTIGYVHYKRTEYDLAIPLFKQALLKAPESALLRYHLGSAQHKSGLKDEAKKNLETALSSNQNFYGKEEAEEMLAAYGSESQL